jgi:hypothetical protein
MQAFPPIDSQLNYFNSLGQKSAETIQALSALNVRLTQQLAEDAALSYQQLMASNDPWQMATIAFKRLQPVSEHLQHYQRRLLDMVVGATLVH